MEDSNGKENIREKKKGGDGDSKMGICLGKAGQVRELVMYGTGATLIDSGIAFLWG